MGGVKVEQKEFEHLMLKARAFQRAGDRTEFWTGFQRGLRRRFHGETFGTPEEHEKWMNLDDGRRDLRTGYRLGFHYGEIPAEPKRIRELLNLSTDDLAEIAGVSPRTVEGWEQGRAIPKPALRLIQNFLNA